jgi:hypothetical protein
MNMPLIHIHDLNFHQFIGDAIVDGEQKRRGLVPRNYSAHPLGSYAGSRTAVEMKVIDAAEWPRLIREKAAAKARLSDIRLRGNGGNKIPSRDQNGRGYCWQHSGVSAMLLARARDNQPYADLSAYGPACVIKNFRDEGGWGAQGVDFLRQRGCPTSDKWPQKAVDRKYDNEETWANAKLYRVDEGWWDLNAAQYDRNLTWQQFVTCWLVNDPTVNDYNWWGHSVCGADAVDGESMRGFTRMESGKLATLQEFEFIWAMNDPILRGIGCRIWNSWGDSWGEDGMGILSGQKAVPDGGVAIRSVTASAA